MLGSGGSSEAVMTRSCITSTPSFFFPSTFNGATLNGQNFGNGITGEYNNLTTSNFPIASCSDGLCGAAAHGVSTDWSKTDGVKSCYPGDIPQPPLKPSTTPQATEDDSSVYTANGNHIRQCKSNALMIGVDASDSRFLCSATLPPAGKLTVDKSTKGTYVYQNLKSGLRAATLHSVHVCPANSAMVGWNQSADLLLCGQIPPSGYVPVTPSHFGADSVDGPGGTQVPEPNFPSTHLHACDVKGSGGPLAVVGIDVANNVLVCRNANSVPRLQ
jgi:hypothetical protein